ncbi:MAG TPA: bifunctional (p)ppGpp synthetase/guanosine-3',5'-bis(diphosphate) 3'-pyrophosphohydrolase [bacterium]|jgi:guanosine-3',5'-bis(diphosphate) 3'-pyrophosphohydrolase|nr:bifunctional (p)ppGpp synthetase/guanosine-3',5'-bis(diphosphate) 3'-pyrophosphohydrolase [bacterium]
MTLSTESEFGLLLGPEAYSRTPSLDEILAMADSAWPDSEKDLLKRAYDFAQSAHSGQLRASGAPYFSHAAHTALELARLGLDGATVAAGLLHDVVEDTATTGEQLAAAFGPEVAQLVEGVTKISVRMSPSGDEAKAENLRKMLVAMAKDVRVLLIKLADRLHNIRTLVYVREEKQRRIAAETLEVYAQLANRLGIHQWKWEMEDRCMAVLYPAEFAELSAQIGNAQGDRATRLMEARSKLAAKLAEAGIPAEINGRNKHIWSIYQKILRSHKRFEELYDLVALRVVTSSVPDCYASMGIIHALWTPLPGRVKDYIAIPKSNMYQSLHTTVVGPAGLPLEIQVRTEDMHRISERGIAAHWKYKSRAHGGVSDLPFLKNVVEWQKESRDAKEFVENLKIDLYDEEVFIFTPKGEVKMLPKGGTVIDFAYAVHSTVGDQCYGAVVNGKMAPLRQELASGDIVRVLTSPQHHPNKDWLLYARTGKAKNRIRRALRHYEKEADALKGQEILEKLLKRNSVKINELARSSHMMEAARHFGFAAVEDLLAAIGLKEIEARAVLERLQPALPGAPVPAAQPQKPKVLASTTDQGVEVRGLGGVVVAFARCCAPVRGDAILGYVTVGRGVSIHRADCVNAADLLRKSERLVEVRWAGEAAEARPVELDVAAWDRPNLMADMLLAIARTTSAGGKASNLSAASASGLDGGVAQARFTVAIYDLEHLKRLMLNLYQVEGVTSVKRRDRRVKIRSTKESPGPQREQGADPSDSA